MLVRKMFRVPYDKYSKSNCMARFSVDSLASFSASLVDGPEACHHLIAGMKGTIEDDKLA